MTSVCKHCGTSNHPGRMACYACEYPLGRLTSLPLTTADGERGHEFFAIDLEAAQSPLPRPRAVAFGAVAASAGPAPAIGPSPAGPVGPSWWKKLLRSADDLLKA